MKIFNKLETLNPFDKMKYNVDMSLILLANKRKILVSGLESIMDQFKTFSKTDKARALFPYLSNPDKTVLERVQNSDYLGYELIEAWQNGDDKDIEFITHLQSNEETKVLLDDRNEKWLNNKENGLLDKLKNTSVPVCIAVGAAHCFGDAGLVKAFEANGLKMTRIGLE